MLKINNPFSTDTTLKELLIKELPLSIPKPTGGKTEIIFDRVTKVYPMGKRNYQALSGVSLTIQPGEFVAIVGPSGSGKSTILNIMTGIDRPTSGTISVGDKNL